MAIEHKFKATCILLVLLLANTEALRMVCYYTNWAQYRPGNGKFLPENIDMNLCTHVMYAFGKPVGLDLQPFEWNDDDSQWSDGMYTRVLKMKRNNSDVKILLAIGGYNMGSAPFIPLVQTAYSRSTFVRNTIAFLRKRNFDGLDMDWEYPAFNGSLPSDKPKFQLLMEELMQGFKADGARTGKPRLLLTVAVPAGKTNIDNGYYPDKLARTVDFISIMTYDLNGAWVNLTGFNAPLYAHPSEEGSATQLNVDWASRYWVSLGAPKEKLNVGIATYGRSFTLKDPNYSDILSIAIRPGDPATYSREKGVMAYYEICELMPSGDIVQVPSQMVPYIVKGDQWIGYDDVPSVKAKACYIITNGYGGMLFWTIDFDDFTGTFCNQGVYPLLNAAFNTIKDPSKCGTQILYQPNATPAPSADLEPPPSGTTSADMRSVCYYTNWAQYRPGKGRFVPENVDTDLCTHLIYAFAIPKGLTLEPFEWNDDNTEWSEGMFSRTMKLRNKKPSLKILLAAGGYNMASAPFIPLVETEYSRSAFAKNLITFLRKRNFDGFDMDWEYPGDPDRGSSPEDKQRLQLLMEEIMRAFKRESAYTGRTRLMLTVAVPAGKRNIDMGYYPYKLAKTVDFISMMTYDLHGVWDNMTGFNSPLYSHPNEQGAATYLSVDWASRYWVSLGAPKYKLNVGISTYGRSFTLENPNRNGVMARAWHPGKAAPYSRENGVIAYYEICDMMPGAQIVQVPSQMNPYLLKGDQWVGFDDVQSVKAKACYACENGYGGILFWTIDFDDFSGQSCNQGPYPLMKAAYNIIKDPKQHACSLIGSSLEGSSNSGIQLDVGHQVVGLMFMLLLAYTEA